MGKREHEPFDVEAALRNLVPRADSEFTASLGGRVRSQLRDARPTRLRLGLALATTSAIVVALAAFGGLGYAASVANQTAAVVRDAVELSPQTPQAAGDATSADVQYSVTICHRTGLARRPWIQIGVARDRLQSYLARGDFVVTPSHACPPPRVICRIVAIRGRSVTLSCTAGRVRAGKPWTIVVGVKLLAHGKLNSKGGVVTHFIVPQLLHHGSSILFRIQGFTEATLHF